MADEHIINKYIIIISILTSFGVAFTSNAVSVALPTMAVDLNITNILQNWLVNVYLLVIAALSVPFGKLSGRYGLKKTMQIGLIVYVIGSIMSGLSYDGYMMILSRIIQGIGSAFLFVNGMAMVTIQIPQNKRGEAIGLTVTGVYAGLTVAPTFGGILVQNLSWRSIFYITIPLIAVAYYYLIKIDKEWIDNHNNSFDFKGSLLFVIGIILLMYGFTVLNHLNGIICLVAGLLTLLLFVKYELKAANPVYNMRLFTNKKYTSSNIASLISYFATFVITYILNYHFQYLNGYDAQTTGLILIVTPLLMVIFAPMAGKLSDKVEPQILAAAGMSIVTISTLILCFISQDTPMHIMVISMILQGIGFGLFSTPNNNVIMSSVDKKDVATASASLSTVRTIGQSFSLGLLTLIFELIMGNVHIVPEYFPLLTLSSQITMVISTVFCMMAVILSLIGIKTNNAY